ncbi:MAG: hypothetical protein N2747_06540 [Chitinophagaceae bacterium]|nr:hypothetical protein [Chitinophagaceae bacterium]
MPLCLLSAVMLCSSFCFAQTLTGIWTGTLTHDSNTLRKDQLFELILTEYKGKVRGYSRNEFIVNDTLYYIVKRVKGEIKGNLCEVKDEEIITCNFFEKLDKGVKVTITFKRNSPDSAWYMSGNWKTNATKKYYSLTGKTDLSPEEYPDRSKLVSHLQELRLVQDIPFLKEIHSEIPVITLARPQSIKTEYKTIDNHTETLKAGPPQLPPLKEFDHGLAQNAPKEKDVEKTGHPVPGNAEKFKKNETPAYENTSVVNTATRQNSATVNTESFTGNRSPARTSAEKKSGENLTNRSSAIKPVSDHTNLKNKEAVSQTSKANDGQKNFGITPPIQNTGLSAMVSKTPQPSG